ncbi:hypothetical protein CR203_03735 [Salipaludibacillus neizhouensis]|uniref:HTH cro/C1-type domain-containing protein n=1 Tax=Salipaludibacillus neizhouensis TaxID=885475 RepID=A0A3A9KHW5_9BACI|nr:helix-turn-helix transcriptional regulator [Salipaludibacillus neizhouensis]RKL69153.1 hypothetical protein CR203_03735 [Salipaludibacillus neizhouensis]
MQKEIGFKIKTLRLENKMTQEELGKRLGVSDAYISHMESGRRKISIDFLEVIADILEVTLPYFFTDKLTEFHLNEKEIAWIKYYKVLEKEGFTIDDIRLWVEIAKSVKKNI